MKQLSLFNEENGKFISVNAENDYLGNKFMYFYNIFANENFLENIIMYNGFEELINIIYEKHKIDKPQIIEQKKFIENDHIYFKQKQFDDKKILIAFSGGLDSVYTSLLYKDLGYEVILFHLDNLNKNYPNEDIKAKEFSQYYNFKLININVKHIKKQHYIDNPVKNQMILTYMLDYALNNGIINLLCGSDETTSINDAKIGLTITDSYEVYKYYMKAINSYFPQIKLHFIEKNITKLERIKYILKKDRNCLNYIYSCITPHRFNQKLHFLNIEKYNINLLDKRCGSCFKCCMEYILLYELGYYNNEKMLEHCYYILATSKNTHAKELFDLKLSYEERRKNVLKYMS